MGCRFKDQTDLRTDIRPPWDREDKPARRLTNRKARHDTCSLIVQERWDERSFPKAPRTHGWLTW